MGLSRESSSESSDPPGGLVEKYKTPDGDALRGRTCLGANFGHTIGASFEGVALVICPVIFGGFEMEAMMPAQIQPSSHPPVLLIESEKPLRARLTDILEGEHLTPICCETGAEALDACIRFEVHVAVLNLCVSDSDGLRLLDQLLACRRELKVIVHTGEAVLDSADMALHRGAFAYVQQLNGVDALLAQVHRAFHRHLADDREKLQFEIQRQTQALGEANRALKRLERVSLELSEREQRRFGRALHDGLGQLLTGAALNSKLLEAQLAKQVRPEAEQATQLVAIVNQAIRQTQRKSTN